MSFLNFFKVLIILLIFISCNNKSNDSFSTESEAQTESTNIENLENSKPKYVFAIFTVEEPNLKIENEIDFTAKLEPYDLDLKYKDIYDVEYKKVIYKSEIQEIYNCDDQLKFKFLDDFEIELETQLNLKNMAYHNNLWIKCKDDEARELLMDNVSNILERTIYTFDTYSEASKSRQTF